MSRSSVVNTFKWIALAAIVAGAALLSWSFLDWGQSQSAAYQQQALDNVQQYNIYAKQHVRENCGKLVQYKRFECVAKSLQEQRAYHRDEYDLVAQRQAALWGYTMAVAAIAGLLLSFIGVVLVWTTFQATKIANEIARQSFRPWIEFSIEHIQLVVTPTEIDISFALIVKNTGQWVANNIEVDEFHLPYYSKYNKELDVNKLRWPNEEPLHVGSLAPGEWRDYASGAKIPFEKGRAIRFIVCCRANYGSIGNSAGQTVSAFNIRPDVAANGGYYQVLSESTKSGAKLTAYRDHSAILK